MAECITCKVETKYVINIKFKAVPMCNNCCNTITQQQVKWLVDDSNLNNEQEHSQSVRKSETE